MLQMNMNARECLLEIWARGERVSQLTMLQVEIGFTSIRESTLQICDDSDFSLVFVCTKSYERWCVQIVIG